MTLRRTCLKCGEPVYRLNKTEALRLADQLVDAAEGDTE